MHGVFIQLRHGLCVGLNLVTKGPRVDDAMCSSNDVMRSRDDVLRSRDDVLRSRDDVLRSRVPDTSLTF